MAERPAQLSDSLRITEIFYSIQGEAATSGYPTVFVRLTGCPLRCTYCDTAYAFEGGKRWRVDEVVEVVKGYPTPWVTITGGEPLAQPAVFTLMTALCDAGHRVSLETSGALSVAQVDPRVSRVLDIKTPGSGEVHRNDPTNWTCLTGQDQIKFVLVDRQDFDWAVDWVSQHTWPEGCVVWFSPSFEDLSPATLGAWMLAEPLLQGRVRLQVQLHKLLNCQ